LEIRKVIRVSEILAVLLIGVYWLIFPNNFSEPLIIILGALAVLFGELLNHSLKKKKKQITLDSRALLAQGYTAFIFIQTIFQKQGFHP
jgi:chromate transport protein ChrA